MANDEENTEDQAAPPVMEQKIKKEMRFKLSAEEKNKMADEAARLSKERDAKVDELKEISKGMKADIKANQKEIDRLLDCHMKGSELREVEVVEQLDWENKRVRYYHNDELMEDREMHEAELQMKLGTNPTRKKKPKETKAQRNPDKHLTPEEMKNREIAEVHKLETKKSTKRSAVDQADSHPSA